MERALKADFAFVKAWKGDRQGNLIYRKTARNFNPMMATAAEITIVEVEHLVEVGDLAPDQIHTSSIYVKRIFQGELYEGRIERKTVRKALTTNHYPLTLCPPKTPTSANASSNASPANCKTASTSTSASACRR